MTNEQICNIFNCTPDQLKTQYAANAKTLSEMHNKAVKAGKKVNGYSATALEAMTAKYANLAQAV